MTAALLGVTLLVLLVAGATLGPRVLGGTGPTFSTHPRLGIAFWMTAAGVWTLAFLAMGPLLSWVFTGPQLPGAVGAVCQRCVAAANPFRSVSPLWATSVPVITLILVPAALAGGLIIAALVHRVRDRKILDTHVDGLLAFAERRLLRGTPVWVMPSTDRAVYSLPDRRARIVISQGALAALTEDQLTAVLAHERAHLDQRHHLLAWAMNSLQSVLGWVPLIAAGATAVAGYAEMAADDEARRASSTRALAGALLALRGPRKPVAPLLALHIAEPGTPWRARRLALPPAPPSRWGMALTVSYLAAMTTAIVLIGSPYAALALNGTC